MNYWLTVNDPGQQPDGGVWFRTDERTKRDKAESAAMEVAEKMAPNDLVFVYELKCDRRRKIRNGAMEVVAALTVEKKVEPKYQTGDKLIRVARTRRVARLINCKADAVIRISGNEQFGGRAPLKFGIGNGNILRLDRGQACGFAQYCDPSDQVKIQRYFPLQKRKSDESDNAKYQENARRDKPREDNEGPLQPEYTTAAGHKKVKLDPAKGAQRLKLASYKCEFDPTHLTFKTPSGHPFMELHHLVPLQEQPQFRNSLDRVANILCLCPNCHRWLHHGTFNKKMSKKLQDIFKKRRQDMQQAGISLDETKLWGYYQ